MTKRGWTALAMAWLGVLLVGAGPALGLSDLETAGKMIYKDQNLSLYQNQSCKTCHHPGAGFADPENRKDPAVSVVSTGSDGVSRGGRNAPTSAYAGFSPPFGWFEEDGEKVFVGGMFWDGRATGAELGDPLAEQARGPFLNPVEMAMTRDGVVNAVAAAPYAGLFVSAWADLGVTIDWADMAGTYDRIAMAIAAYERSEEVTRFRSVFDEFWRACQRAGIEVSAITTATDLQTLPRNILTLRQLRGLALFNDPARGNCAACHVTTDHRTIDGRVFPPLFTDSTYDNLGLPRNPLLSGDGDPPDLGLGGTEHMAQLVAGGEITPTEKDAQNGKFKVPTVRNVAKNPPYGHNGYFATLAEIVHFYNARDVLPPAWPVAEVPETVNTGELGDLGLTADEEDAIVAFLRTLTDQP